MTEPTPYIDYANLPSPTEGFLATLFITILVLRGRVNFRNLSRYCDYSESLRLFPLK